MRILTGSARAGSAATARMMSASAAAPALDRRCMATSLEHDPEKWAPVFGKDHAPRINFPPCGCSAPFGESLANAEHVHNSELAVAPRQLAVMARNRSACATFRPAGSIICLEVR